MRECAAKRIRSRFVRVLQEKPIAVEIGLFVAVVLIFACIRSCAPSSDTVLLASSSDAGKNATAPAEDGAGASSETTAEKPAVVVYLSGCVASPGVYELDEGSRVVDAIAAAGGASDNAALDALNLARVVADGEHVHIPSIEESASGVSAPSAEEALRRPDGKVNINTATAEQLDALEGIGPSTASKIIEDRSVNGPFSTIEDIKRVPGIGDKKFEALADSICVG